MTDVDKVDSEAAAKAADHIRKFGITKPPPELDTTEELVDWAAERQKRLMPRAMQELEFQLMYGTEKARREVALELKRSNGLSLEKGGSNTAPIIVINASTVSTLPWSAKKKLISDGAVTEAELVTDAKK